MTGPPDDRWHQGDAYESFMGRWSRLAAVAFVEWLALGPGAHWLEIGCGTGALTTAICASADPASVTACDPSASFVDHARLNLADERASFLVAGADAAPTRAGGFDVVVSGLVLNFLPEPRNAVASLAQRLRRGGTVAAYVWDYGEGMEFLRAFWDEVVAEDPAAASADEGQRFPLCRRPALEQLWRDAGLAEVQTGAITVPTRFASFDEYWSPFLRGTGPAPAYVASLPPAGQDALRERLRRRRPADRDGAVPLRARAWAVRGTA